MRHRRSLCKCFAAASANLVVLWCLFALAASDAFSQEQAKLKEFTSKNGGFTVLLPGTPVEGEVDIDAKNGVKIVQYQFLVDGGTKAHLVAYQDHPAAMENVDQEKKVLESGRDFVVERFKGKVLQNKDLKLLDKHSGMEFQVEIPELNSIYRSRIYLVGKRLYQIVILGPKEVIDSKEAETFLDSFKLTAK